MDRSTSALRILNTGISTIVWTIEILHRLIRMGSADLVAAAPYPGKETRTYRKGQWRTKTRTHARTHNTTQHTQTKENKKQHKSPVIVIIIIKMCCGLDLARQLPWTWNAVSIIDNSHSFRLSAAESHPATNVFCSALCRDVYFLHLRKREAILQW